MSGELSRSDIDDLRRYSERISSAVLNLEILVGRLDPLLRLLKIAIEQSRPTEVKIVYTEADDDQK